MSRILFDLSGTRGLANKYHGEVDGVSNPHLKYQAKEGEFADGIMNPLRRDGFISGYNTAVTKTITGTLIKSFVYDDANDDIYAAGSANLIYRLDTPSDTSYTTVITLDATSDIYDMDLYEVNGFKALVYTSNYASVEQKVVLGSTAATRHDTWTRVESVDAAFFPDLLTYGEGQFWTANQGDSTIYRSYTGYNGWSTWDTFTGINMIKYINDKLIVGGSAAASNFGYTSTMADIATIINDSISDDFEYWDGVYGAGLYVFAGNGPASTNVITWDGGGTFTLRTTDTNPLYCIAWDGTTFVAAGADSAIFSSTDGITWTRRSASNVRYWTNAAYGNGYFVLVGAGGTNLTARSTDGITWVYSSVNDSINPSGLKFADGQFIVTGNTGVSRCTIPTSWTSINTSVYGKCIDYGNGYFVIGSFNAFGSADNGGNRYPFYISGTLTDYYSSTPDKACVGFYCLDTDEGIYNISSTVKKTFPSTYESQTIAWNTNDEYRSEYTHLRQKIALYDEDDKKIEKIRIGLMSYLQENTVLKVSVFQGDHVSSASTAAYETTISLTATDSPVYKDYIVDFGTQSALTGANAFIEITLNSLASTTLHGYVEWIISPLSGSLLGAHDGVAYGYNGTSWVSIGGADSNPRSFDVSVIKSSSPFWTRDYITNKVEIDLTTSTNFIRKADNGFLYWFTDNKVHSIDGTVTGGSKGRLRKNLLQFPAYYNIVEAIDYRGRQYIAIQSTSGTQSDLSTNSNWSGVYVWDRLSQVTNFRDFIAIPGIQSFKAFFIDAAGSLMLICIGNDKQTQLRKFSGSEFTLVKTLGVDAYPISQRGVSVLNQISYWYGQDGILYGYGSTVPGGTPQLYKLANLEAGVDTAGAVITADNSSSLNNLRIITSFKESTDEGILSYKPFDANATYTAGGEVWTAVQILPSLSTVTYIRGVHIPNSISSPSAATNIATVSCYLNMSPTAAWTKTLTQVDMNRGYWEKEFNKSNVNSIQFKISWLGQTLATGDYSPMYIDVKITEEARPK